MIYDKIKTAKQKGIYHATKSFEKIVNLCLCLDPLLLKSVYGDRLRRRTDSFFQ